MNTAEYGRIQRSTCPLERWLGDKNPYSASRAARLDGAINARPNHLHVSIRGEEKSQARAGHRRGVGGRWTGNDGALRSDTQTQTLTRHTLT